MDLSDFITVLDYYYLYICYLNIMDLIFVESDLACLASFARHHHDLRLDLGRDKLVSEL